MNSNNFKIKEIVIDVSPVDRDVEMLLHVKHCNNSIIIELESIARMGEEKTVVINGNLKGKILDIIRHGDNNLPIVDFVRMDLIIPLVDKRIEINKLLSKM